VSAGPHGPGAGSRALAIISDTHLPRGTRWLPESCLARLATADLILHAGDITTVGVLEALQALGPPLLAVCGNVDDAALREALPDQLVVELADGVRVGMVHDAGPAKGRPGRMRRRFPDCAAVVFGHSHIPLVERDTHGFIIFNPGSPTDRRRQPRHTMGEGRVAAGTLVLGHVALD
jgi:putative phosphoesterase